MPWARTAARTCIPGTKPCPSPVRKISSIILAIAFFGGKATPGLAQEITPFRLTGVDGYTTMRYVRDSFVTAQPASGLGAKARSREGQSSMREEIFLMTHSYVYHPNFLSLDIGGGPILQQGSSVSDAGESHVRGELYNFSGRATFLRDKPYQGSVFFEHLNPTLSVAPGMILAQENTRYGLDISLLAPVTSVPLHLDATRSHFQARGADRVIDDQSDRVSLKATKSYGTLGTTQLHYQNTQQSSVSGSPNLPIQASTSISQGLNADSRFQFGSNRQYDITNLIAMNSQSYMLGQGSLPDRKDMRLLFDLRARHSDQLHTFGTFNHSTSNQGDLGSTVHSGVAGINYWPIPELATTLGLRGDDNQTRQFSARSRGLDGSMRYQQALPVGMAQASYALRYNQHEQLASAGQTTIIGERIALSGTTVVTLSHQRVATSSVIISNNSRTQTFVEGRDYTLSTVGQDTRLQRLISGNIVDGQEVLIDYSYDVGGSYAYKEAEQTMNLNWGLLSYVNLYLRHYGTSPQLKSGAPTFPLNTVRGSVRGARFDVPLRRPFEIMIGGGLESEVRQETINPFHRQTQDVYAQTEEPFFGLGNVRISAHRARVEYENSLQNVNLKGYDLRYWSRTWFGLDVSADASHEIDTGTPVQRRRTLGSLKAQWRYRQVNVTAELAHTREIQGAVERTRDLIQLLVRRDI